MDISVNVMLAKDGTEILEICRNGNVYRMNSLYRPDAEAEKFAKQYGDMEKESVLVVFGYGNGIFPKAIMQAIGSHTKVVFYEPEGAVLQCISNPGKEIGQVLGSNGYMVTPDKIREEKHYYSMSEFPKLLEELISYSNQKKVRYITLPKYREIFPEQYKHFEEQIVYRIRRLQSNTATAKAMGHNAVVNNIKNLRYIPESYCADSFLGIFPKDMAAIVVSAGPSLEKNVHVLRQAKGCALIVCVDSAVKYLLRENMIPDLLVTVDPLKPLELFDDERIDGIPVVISSDMNSKVLERLPHSKVIFASTENDYIQSLYEDSNHGIERLESGGSVATLAFSLCRYWGFSCVILVGQDLALTDSQMYAGRGKLPDEFNRELLEVEDIYGNTIHTVRDYYYYLKWFEQAVAAHPEVRVIDATEGGAKIAGTEIMTLQDALAEYRGEEFDFGTCLENVSPAFSDDKREFVEKRIQKSKQILNKLLRQLETGITLCQKGMQFVKQGVGNPQTYQQIDREIQKICEFYDQLDEGFLIQREIDAVNLERFMELFDGERENSRKEQYENLEKYFEIVKEAATVVRDIWEQI